MFFDMKAVTIKRSRTEAYCLYWHIRILLFITRAPRINSESFSLWFWQQFTLIHFKCFEITLRDYVLFCHCTFWILLCWVKCNSIVDSEKMPSDFTSFNYNSTYPNQLYFSTGIVSFRCDIFPNLIELFWKNTKSLRFVLLLRILTIAVLILKKYHRFYLLWQQC